MISFSSINIISKYLNPDASNCNSNETNNITEPINRNLVKNFKLPIQYLDGSQLFSITDNVSDDLELITKENEKQKTMYHYLFKPTHHFGENLIPEWKKYYTTNIDYLNDTKNVLENMDEYRKSLLHDNFDYKIKCEKINDIWNDLKHNEDFLSKYNYIEWDMIKHFNKSTDILQIISIMNLASPMISFILPFILLIIPFIILKFQNIPITFDVYLEVLKEIAKNHFIGKALTTGMSNLTPDKVLYLIFIFGFYLLQIYQNVTMCNRMYNNTIKINEYLLEMREYINYSIKNMQCFLKLNKEIKCYNGFCYDISKHCNELEAMKTLLNRIKPFELSFGKLLDMGYLLKCYYELHSHKEWENSLVFSFGFEGYMNNLLGVYENLENKNVSFANFDLSGNCNIEKQYYPPLVDEKPVKNDCKFDKNIIISSPNAGGKTTIIKSTMLNIIFTQQLGCGFYKYCVLNPYTHIHSYLNIPDTSGRDSLFQAESRRCKEIIDIINDSKENSRHFGIFDELYSGTNPKEATKSSYAFLLYLSKKENVNFMLTTHYVAICSKFKKSNKIQNYKMVVENLDNGCLKYTYKMKKGISKIQGAVKILEQMDYPKEIIDNVKNYL
jgi:hypothetical protein